MKTLSNALIAALGVALLALGASGLALSDSHRGRDDDHDRRGTAPLSGPAGTAWAQTQDRYRSECGGCHLAYPPGLLPAAAWGRVLDTLPDHFGDDASLDPALTAELRAFLTAHAGDRGPMARPAAVPVAAGEGPPRITQTRRFLREHDEIPARPVAGNPKVGSFSNCQACHRGAEQGRFDEDDVSIPGAGHWED